MARATASSLKVQRSSSEPPPRPTITTSGHLVRLKYSMPRQTSSTEPSPCTSAGKRRMCRPGKRRDRIWIMSAMAAPRGEVTMPMRRGKRGSGRLRSAAKRPSAASFFLSCSKASCSAPEALRLEQFHQQLVFAARFVDVDAAARQHRQSVLRLEFPVAVGGAEGHALHLGIALLQGEVVVAAGGQFEAGDLAGHRDIGELAVEHGADGGVQFADAEDAALRKEVEVECELLHERMVARSAAPATSSPRGSRRRARTLRKPWP